MIAISLSTHLTTMFPFCYIAGRPNLPTLLEYSRNVRQKLIYNYLVHHLIAWSYNWSCKRLPLRSFENWNGVVPWYSNWSMQMSTGLINNYEKKGYMRLSQDCKRGERHRILAHYIHWSSLYLVRSGHRRLDLLG